MNRKFRRRFMWMEDRLRESGRGAADATPEELERLWQRAKEYEGKNREVKNIEPGFNKS
jgi:uncharacterized protein YabN with tetrapyrrole methylase and pyrophosphatase domain